MSAAFDWDDDRPWAVGDLLRGFCGGYFGHSYGDKRVEGLGEDWIVAREEDTGNAVYADMDDPTDWERLRKYRL